MPDMFPLSGSQTLASVGYEADEVYIKFKSGQTYVYPGTEADRDSVRRDPSGSKGHYFYEYIKPRKFRRT